VKLIKMSMDSYNAEFDQELLEQPTEKDWKWY
jgi:hypothetical protein